MRRHPIYTNYLCNDQGEVFSLHTKKKLEPAPNIHGYLQLTTRDNGNKITKSHHVLIWECHHGLISEGFEIDHIDGNKLNNCLRNLACLTRAEHRAKTHKDNPHIAKNFGKSKCKKVLRVSAETCKSNELASVTEAALSVMGYRYAICQAIRSGCSYRGFLWSFVDDFDFEGEYWDDVVDHNIDGVTVVLKVSNYGRFQYGNNSKKKYGYKTPHGYRFRYLGRQYGVHELICHVCKGSKPTIEHTVDHLNRDPFDNRPENLRWATKKEQARNLRSVRNVEGYVLKTGFSLGIWATITDAAAATGARQSHISNVIKGRRKSSGKTSDGDKIAWRYDESLFV